MYLETLNLRRKEKKTTDRNETVQYRLRKPDVFLMWNIETKTKEKLWVNWNTVSIEFSERKQKYNSLAVESTVQWKLKMRV